MKEERPAARGRDWKWYLSIFLPIALLAGFAIVFSGSSSGSDCGSDDSDCSSSSTTLTGVCGAPANVDKSGTARLFQAFSIKSGQTDMRCGYGLGWKYSWTKEKKPAKAPSVSISVSAGKASASKVNKADTAGSDGWSGTYTVAQGSIGGKDPIPGTITVTASFTPDMTSMFDSVNVTMHLIYYTMKK